MIRKHVKERQAKRIAEGKADQASRCTFCKRALPTHYVVNIHADGEAGKFCSADCWLDQSDALKQVTR